MRWIAYASTSFFANALVIFGTCGGASVCKSTGGAMRLAKCAGGKARGCYW